MAFSLAYVSEIVLSLQTDANGQRAALLAIENSAHKRNPSVGVRGLLVYVAGYFIQWLEGEEAAVRTLMRRIAVDSRHHQLQVVHEGNGPEKLKEWSMSLATRADKDGAVALLITRLRAGQMPEAVTGSVPADIFQCLLAPRELQTLAAGQKCCQIALLGQTGLWSAAVVTYLSDLWKVPVQRTRLIGRHGFEREALLEYVDAVHPQLGPIRVMNFSGNVLQLPWIRSLLENVHTHALFYSINQLDAALEFTENAMGQLPDFKNNRIQPIMACLFGRTARPLMLPTQNWFEAQGLSVSAVSMSLADVGAVWQTIESLTVGNHSENLPASVPAAAPAPALDPVAPQAPAPQQLAAALVSVSNMGPVVKSSMSSAPGPAKAPILVSVKTTQTRANPAQSMPELGTEAEQWLEDLLTIRGVQWAGAQIGELSACAYVTCIPNVAATPVEVKVQTQHFKNRLAQESRLHKILRLRVDLGESIQMVSRYANAFEVSFNLPAPNGPVVVVLQSMPGSADLAVVLSSLEKRLLEPLPVFFSFGKVVKAA